MPKSTVFITGATGFIGAHVALSALKAGYSVRLSVRREAQIEPLRRALDAFANKLDFVVVSDYTAANVFDSALKEIDYVIHVASPLPKPNEDLLTPAVQGTTSILESASRTSTVKKVVITASVLSFVPLGKGGDGITVKGKFYRPPKPTPSCPLTSQRGYPKGGPVLRSLDYSHPRAHGTVSSQ
jgi:nucleoside-diphosphate-sugar epimerase